MTAQRRLAPGKYRLQVEDYVRLWQAGVFEGHRTELIEGEVIVMSPQYRPHGMVKMRLYDALRDALAKLESPLRPVVEFSLALAADSMPDPDIMLTSEPDGEKAVPLATVPLIVEVADSSLTDDLTKKQVIYARGGVPEYWVVDVNGRMIHQMWAPANESYARRREVAFGQPLAAESVDGLEIDTAMP